MFAECNKLNYLNILNFGQTASYDKFFTDLPPKGTIKVKRNVYKKIEDLIPEDWKKIIKK